MELHKINEDLIQYLTTTVLTMYNGETLLEDQRFIIIFEFRTCKQI